MNRSSDSTLIEPTTDPDFRSYSIEIWFKEDVYAYRRGDLKWDVCPLSICPVTGNPMYLPPYFPASWNIIYNKNILEAFMRHTLEKELLGIDIFSEGKNENK